MEQNTSVWSRRGGLFNQPRQTREVTHTIFGSFLVRITGSGHITMRAAFGSEGKPLAIPEKGKGQQGITLDATSGGKVTETLWGWKANRHLEYSSGEHRVLAIARSIFYQIYLKTFLKVTTGEKEEVWGNQWITFSSEQLAEEWIAAQKEEDPEGVYRVVQKDPRYPVFQVERFAWETDKYETPVIDWEELLGAINNPK